MPPEQFDVAQVMAAVRQEQVGWQAGETTMTALPEQERRYRLGYVPGPGEPSLAAREQIAQALLARAPAAADYPRSFDLRSVGGQNFITPVKDQGSCGSCVAFGTIATVEGTLRFSRSDPNLAVDYSEAHLFYCHARAESRNCGNGWWVDSAMAAASAPIGRIVSPRSPDTMRSRRRTI